MSTVSQVGKSGVGRKLCRARVPVCRGDAVSRQHLAGSPREVGSPKYLKTSHMDHPQLPKPRRAPSSQGWEPFNPSVPARSASGTRGTPSLPVPNCHAEPSSSSPQTIVSLLAIPCLLGQTLRRPHDSSHDKGDPAPSLTTPRTPTILTTPTTPTSGKARCKPGGQLVSLCMGPTRWQPS